MGVSAMCSLLCVTDTLVRFSSGPCEGFGVPEMRDGILFVELEAKASSEMNLRV